MMIGMAFLLAPGQALAKDGWYMGMDLGVAFGQSLNTRGSDDDLPTTCDELLLGALDANNPLGALDANHPDCITPGENWLNKFDGGTGVLAGLALGYRWQNFRVEWEYFHRNAAHDDTSDINDSNAQNVKKTDQEIATQDETINDVLSNNFFANLYYDFPSNSKWTPYLGVGVGLARVSLDYFGRFTRSVNPENIKTFGPPDASNLNRRQLLAGTTSIGRSKLSDTLFGYQAIAGVDYRISDPVTIGLKFRWADFSEFEDGDEWIQLRSHDSTNSLSGRPRVRNTITVDDIKFWGLSLNMKYHF